MNGEDRSMLDTKEAGMMMKTFMAIVAISGFISFSASAAAAAAQPVPVIELGAPFADNAVLQRGMKVPVWGWSQPGTKVSVEFAGQKKTATAGNDGKWRLELDPLQASFEPREMRISESTGKQLVLKNILVGEVWMASGQSNMQWKVQKSTCSKLKVEAKGGVAPIREFEVTSVYAQLHPIERASGSWKDGHYGDYSAIAFAFAHKLYNELSVPVGILNCSFSQTAIQAWVPRIGFRDGKDAYTQGIYKKILETDPATPEHRAAWNGFYQAIEDTLKQNAERVAQGEEAQPISTKTPGNMSGNRDASWLFNARLNPVIPYAIRGGIWNQGYANMGEGLPYYNNLHSLIRGWRLCWDRPELPVYFHQFYCPGQKGDRNNAPSIDGTAEMRLGTWLARDIPHANMASQIDITGAIHYVNKAVPGQRLALHALKNQYGRNLVADGPMFKSYLVKGNQVIVTFDHAEGGLLVAETGSNAMGRGEGATGFADPKPIENGEDQVKLFYLADENRVWYPAAMKIEGDQVVISSPQVSNPRGISYATGGVGFQPNLYNKALLPMTPFIYYDHKLVTSESWPDDKLKVFGEVIDPSTVGKVYEYRKMPLLSVQFRDNAVLQAGEPVAIWGSAVHDWGYEADGEAAVHFSLEPGNGSRQRAIRKTIPVTPGMRQWRYTLPAMPAGNETWTLKATFTIDGEKVHERIAEQVVFGDVWYVAAPSMKFSVPKVDASGHTVRVIKRKAKRSAFPRPSPYSICVSTTPDNRFASSWEPAANDLAGAIGHSIAARTGKPVGIVFMQNAVQKGGGNPEMKTWIATDYLQQAPSLMEDYRQLATVKPGNPLYDANARRYIQAWSTYWDEYITGMMATKRVPDGSTWGSYPSLASAVTTQAGHTYNVMVNPFIPATFKGAIFFASEAMVASDRGAHYGEQLSALAANLKDGFGGEDTHFVYTIPSRNLAAALHPPTAIKGPATGVEVQTWSETQAVITKMLHDVYSP